MTAALKGESRGLGSQPLGAELAGKGMLRHAARDDLMVSASLHGMGGLRVLSQGSEGLGQAWACAGQHRHAPLEVP